MTGSMWGIGDSMVFLELSGGGSKEREDEKGTYIYHIYEYI